MASPQIVRTAHGGINASPFLRLFGRWTDGFVLTAHEAVVYEDDGNGDRRAVDPKQMNALVGAVVKTTGGGLELGTIFDFDNPLFSPAHITPVVRLQPKPGVKYPKWTPSQALSANNFAFGMAVRLDNGTQGTLVDPGDGLPPIGIRPYLLASNPTSVRAAALQFDTTLRFVEGMPVLVDGGPHDGRLLGMLFNLTTGGGTTAAYCSPAAFFVS